MYKRVTQFQLQEITQETAAATTVAEDVRQDVYFAIDQAIKCEEMKKSYK